VLKPSDPITLVVTLAQVIKRRRKAAGLSQQKLAAKAGVSQSTVGNLEAGSRGDKGDVPASLPAIAVALGASTEELAREAGIRLPLRPLDLAMPDGATPVIAWRHEDDLGGEIDPYVFIPRVEIRASAGSGKPIVEPSANDERQPQAFRADWIRRKGWKAANLVCIYADGNSMSPRIDDGDCLLVDRAQTAVIDGKIYAIAWDQEMRVKRLYKRVGGGLIVHSDNEREHPRFDLSQDQLQQVVIVGRVVWIGGDV